MTTPAERAEAADGALTYPSYPALSGSAEARAKHVINREVYRVSRDAIRDQFQAELAEEYAADVPAEVTNAIFSKAWEDGHSSGYYEVQQHYETLADLVRLARRLK